MRCWELASAQDCNSLKNPNLRQFYENDFPFPESRKAYPATQVKTAVIKL